MKIFKSAIAAVALAAVGTCAHASISKTFEQNFNGLATNATGLLGATTPSGSNLAFTSTTLTGANNRILNSPGTDSFVAMPTGNVSFVLNTGIMSFQTLLVSFWASSGTAGATPRIMLDGNTGTRQTGVALGPDTGDAGPAGGNPGAPGTTLQNAGRFYTFTFAGSFASGMHTLLLDGGSYRMDDFLATATSVPEPAGLALAAGGLGMLAFARRNRRQA